jgi:GT2 family glycosyltransferase
VVDDVEVLVVAYRAAELLDECLRRLEEELPVTVVDNSSDPEVRAVAIRHRATYVDPGRNLGFAGGVNVGLARRSKPAVDLLLLNPDASIDPSGVRDLHRCLHTRRELACVAPAQTDPADDTGMRVGWPFPTPLGAWIDAVGFGRLRRRNDFLIGSVLLLRAEALAEVGRFDEQFFLYAEETDWQRRAHDLGWDVALCAEVGAHHVGAGTGGDERERETHFHASAERYIRKYYGSAGWRVYRAGAMAGSLVRAVVLPGERGRAAAFRFRLYRSGPCRAEAALHPGNGASQSERRSPPQGG